MLAEARRTELTLRTRASSAEDSCADAVSRANDAEAEVVELQRSRDESATAHQRQLARAREQALRARRERSALQKEGERLGAAVRDARELATVPPTERHTTAERPPQLLRSDHAGS